MGVLTNKWKPEVVERGRSLEISQKPTSKAMSQTRMNSDRILLYNLTFNTPLKHPDRLVNATATTCLILKLKNYISMITTFWTSCQKSNAVGCVH